MMGMAIAQLKKLKGRSLKELRVRGLQEISKLGERALGLSDGEMTDAALRREIRSDSFRSSLSETVLNITKRTGEYPATSPGLFASLGHREEVTAIIGQRFSDQRRALIEIAEDAIRGRFNLMGFSQVSFGTPIDWHLEPLSGKRAPLDHWSCVDYLNPDVAGDKKIIWELNRHQHFVTFGQAYWITEDERFAEAFVTQTTAWMDADPPKRGINWASSLEVAFRSISWIVALRLFADSASLTPTFLSRMLKYLINHGCHIESYLSHYFSPNTHLTGEALGLFYLGVAFPELRRADAWRDLGLKILLDQLPRQVRRDGVYFEQSTYYHRYTADFYLHLLILARAHSIELPAIEARLAEILDYVMWTTRPEGLSPLIGDDDGGRLIKLGCRRTDDFRDTLATGAALFGRADWKYVSGSAAVETLWLLGPEGIRRYDAIEASPSEETTRAFDETGYYVMRNGWSEDSSFVIVSCPPPADTSCAHAHSDALAFEFAAFGNTWLIDPGTFTYTGDLRWRDEFRLTRAHNTVTVDGESQSVPCGPFSWSHRADAHKCEFISAKGFDYFEGSHRGYERLSDPVTHTRSILFAKSLVEKFASLPHLYLVISDRFKAQSSHHYEIRYHLAPGCEAKARGNRAEIFHPEGDSLDIFVFGNISLQARIEEGWSSRSYGHREPSPVAVFSGEGTASQRFLTLIIPSMKGRAE